MGAMAGSLGRGLERISSEGACVGLCAPSGEEGPSLLCVGGAARAYLFQGPLRERLEQEASVEEVAATSGAERGGGPRERALFKAAQQTVANFLDPQPEPGPAPAAGLAGLEGLGPEERAGVHEFWVCSAAGGGSGRAQDPVDVLWERIGDAGGRTAESFGMEDYGAALRRLAAAGPGSLLDPLLGAARPLLERFRHQRDRRCEAPAPPVAFTLTLKTPGGVLVCATDRAWICLAALAPIDGGDSSVAAGLVHRILSLLGHLKEPPPTSPGDLDGAGGSPYRRRSSGFVPPLRLPSPERLVRPRPPSYDP